MGTGKLARTQICECSEEMAAELMPAELLWIKAPFFYHLGSVPFEISAEDRKHLFQVSEIVPVVPHKAVAEVSKIGNL